MTLRISTTVAFHPDKHTDGREKLIEVHAEIPDIEGNAVEFRLSTGEGGFGNRVDAATAHALLLMGAARSTRATKN